MYTLDSARPDEAVLEEIEAQAYSMSQQAGRILMEQFGEALEVRFKGEKNSDPVTTADRLSEEYLKRAITEKFPEHGILSEEGGALSESESPFLWVLDPLDGTTNFMNGLPLFGVSIGVLWNMLPVAGSIWVPVSHRASAGAYHACLGKGTFLDEESISVADVSSGLPLAGNPSRFGSKFHLFSKKKQEPQEARNLGSIALELALTACGVLRYAQFGNPKLWDAAAGVLLVKEAGGLAFEKRPKSGDWLPLERFNREADTTPEESKKTGGWSSSLVVGAPEITTKVVKKVRWSPPAFSRITGHH